LVKIGVPIEKLNIGGTTARDNGIEISKRAFADSHEITVYESLIDKGVKLFSQYVPADKEIEVTKEFLESKVNS